MVGLSWPGAGAVLAGLALAPLVVYLYRRRDRPGAAWFTASLAAQAVWCTAYGVGTLVTDPALRAGLEAVSWLGLVWVGYLFLGFALEYTGREGTRRSPLYRLLGLVPLAATAALLWDPGHGLLWSGARPVTVAGGAVLDYRIAPFGVAVVVVGTTYAGVGVLLLAETILSYGPLYRTEALAVGVSTVPPLAGVLVWLLDLGAWSVLNWGAILSLPHVVFDAYAFVGNDMFETSPATRRVADHDAIDSVSDPVAVVDDRRRLVDHNAAAAAAFEGVGSDAVGRPADEVLPEDVAAAAEGASGGDGSRYVSVGVDGRRREFKLRAAPLSDARGNDVGRTLQLQDVTEEREREQRLSVLNRVLRHNLRNELTVIDGYAGRIRLETDDGTVADHADRIARSGERLADIGEKARAFDSLVGDDPTFEAIDLAAFLSAAAGEFRGRYPAATVRTRCDDVDLVADRALLRAALANVVENALEHGGEAPTVEVVASETADGRVEIAVTDDGPGIPDSEVAALDGGTETALDHGSGIGLRIVAWSLRRLGGELAFDRGAGSGSGDDGTGSDGTTVRLSLPADPDTGAAGRAVVGSDGDGSAGADDDRPDVRRDRGPDRDVRGRGADVGDRGAGR